MSLTTPRLTLRRFALMNSPGWLRFIGDRGVRDAAGAVRYLEQAVWASYATHGFGLYLAARRDDGTSVGACGLLRRDYLADVDVGFAFLPEFTGCGYASESAARVAAHARVDCGCTHLAGLVQPDNPASIRVLEKIGLRFVAPFTLPNGATLLLYRGALEPAASAS
jgi:RimJ/RimL family protein N-acetyltransferase